MPKSSNGWRVEKPGSGGLTSIAVGRHGFSVKRGYRGTAAKAMRWLIRELDKIESIDEAGWDGTHAYRPVRGSLSVWSDHASGTAYDHNASQHPMGGSQYAGWTPQQVLAIRRLLASPKGQAFVWGADYTRRDSMHFSLKSPATFAKMYKLFL